MKDKILTQLGERVDHVCADKRLNHNELAKELGVTSTTIYQIISGRTKQLSMDLLTKFYQQLNVNMVWLTTGEGEIYVSGNGSTKKPAFQADAPDGYLKDFAQNLEQNFVKLAGQLEVKDQQIASLQETQKSLQEMLKMVLGKPNGVPNRPSRTIPLTQGKANGAYALSTTN